MTTSDEHDDQVDVWVDEAIAGCLDLVAPRSFFLYAGAGSGKTRSLVGALQHVRKSYGAELRRFGRKVAVITYTNAACDEIKDRVRHDALFHISTIHSFAWSLIQGFDDDIRVWLADHLDAQVAKTRGELEKGRPGTKAEKDRKRRLRRDLKRRSLLPEIRRFTYDPDGDNLERGSLNHSEVIGIAANFLGTKATFRAILRDRHPVILVDESQDTNRHLMAALLGAEQHLAGEVSVGLFGDTMQRIYADGLSDLETHIPVDWERPKKRMNHRCPGRVVELANRLRAEVDGHQQQARSTKQAGTVRLFVAPSAASDKVTLEARVAAHMAWASDDPEWESQPVGYKGLILEHSMAAARMGFRELFVPLYRVDRFKTGLLDGTLDVTRLFTDRVLPLIEAKRRGDDFAAAAVVRAHSPMMNRRALEAAGSGQAGHLRAVGAAVEQLWSLWGGGQEPTLLAVLQEVAGTQLFGIPDALQVFAEPSPGSDDEATTDAGSNVELAAVEAALSAPFSAVEAFARYRDQLSPFDTHQGVKGLEFPRVMVILDDAAAGGFLFSYEKLFGAKPASKTDARNVREGKETSIDRTRRLLYVTCSRAEESLAVVAYTADPEALVDTVITRGWFRSEEVVRVTADGALLPPT